MMKATYKRKLFNLGITVIIAGNVVAGRCSPGAVAESSCFDIPAQGR